MQRAKLTATETHLLAGVGRIARKAVAGTVPAHAVDDIVQETAVAASAAMDWLSTAPPPVIAVWSHRVAAHKRADWFRDSARHERRASQSVRTYLPEHPIVEEVERRLDAKLAVGSLIDVLSPQEKNIAARLADGHTVSEIVDQTGLSTSSVKTYLARIRQKSQALFNTP